MTEQKEKEMELVVITGLSGAGMSTALQVFEDMNFFVADGLPPALIKEFISFFDKPEMQHFRGIALGIDLKRKYLNDPLAELLPSLTKIRRQNIKTTMLYIEADKDSILKRYASTRRPHPLEQEGYTLEGAMEEEKNRLRKVRELADFIVDTSGFSLHDLRRFLQNRFFRKTENLHGMWVTVMSFGYKYGIPKDADLVFDMRFLPNPFFDPDLREHSGLEQKVEEYIFGDPQNQEIREKFLRFLQDILPCYDTEGRYRLCIAFGCTGGFHRSVATAEYMAKKLEQSGYRVIKEHKHLPKN